MPRRSYTSEISLSHSIRVCISRDAVCTSLILRQKRLRPHYCVCQIVEVASFRLAAVNVYKYINPRVFFFTLALSVCIGAFLCLFLSLSHFDSFSRTRRELWISPSLRGVLSTWNKKPSRVSLSPGFAHPRSLIPLAIIHRWTAPEREREREKDL